MVLTRSTKPEAALHSAAQPPVDSALAQPESKRSSSTRKAASGNDILQRKPLAARKRQQDTIAKPLAQLSDAGQADGGSISTRAQKRHRTTQSSVLPEQGMEPRRQAKGTRKQTASSCQNAPEVQLKHDKQAKAQQQPADSTSAEMKHSHRSDEDSVPLLGQGGAARNWPDHNQQQQQQPASAPATAREQRRTRRSGQHEPAVSEIPISQSHRKHEVGEPADTRKQRRKRRLSCQGAAATMSKVHAGQQLQQQQQQQEAQEDMHDGKKCRTRRSSHQHHVSRGENANQDQLKAAHGQPEAAQQPQQSTSAVTAKLEQQKGFMTSKPAPNASVPLTSNKPCSHQEPALPLGGKQNLAVRQQQSPDKAVSVPAANAVPSQPALQGSHASRPQHQAANLPQKVGIEALQAGLPRRLKSANRRRSSRRSTDQENASQPGSPGKGVHMHSENASSPLKHVARGLQSKQRLSCPTSPAMRPMLQDVTNSPSPGRCGSAAKQGSASLTEELPRAKAASILPLARQLIPEAVASLPQQQGHPPLEQGLPKAIKSSVPGKESLPGLQILQQAGAARSMLAQPVPACAPGADESWFDALDPVKVISCTTWLSAQPMLHLCLQYLSFSEPWVCC